MTEVQRRDENEKSKSDDTLYIIWVTQRKKLKKRLVFHTDIESHKRQGGYNNGDGSSHCRNFRCSTLL
jgi:hypothetical protein